MFVRRFVFVALFFLSFSFLQSCAHERREKIKKERRARV